MTAVGGERRPERRVPDQRAGPQGAQAGEEGVVVVEELVAERARIDRLIAELALSREVLDEAIGAASGE
ncbi:hypothetical protein ACVNF4_01155 [Streptomyces sp. S6]